MKTIVFWAYAIETTFLEKYSHKQMSRVVCTLYTVEASYCTNLKTTPTRKSSTAASWPIAIWLKEGQAWQRPLHNLFDDENFASVAPQGGLRRLVAAVYPSSIHHWLFPRLPFVMDWLFSEICPPFLWVLCFSVAEPFVQGRDFPAATVPGVFAVVCAVWERCADREAQEPGTTPLLQAVCHSERESTRFFAFFGGIETHSHPHRGCITSASSISSCIGVSCFFLIDVRKRTAFLQKGRDRKLKALQLSQLSFLSSFLWFASFWLTFLLQKLILQRSPL